MTRRGRISAVSKSQVPNPKFQIPSSNALPTAKHPRKTLSFEGSALGFGAWNLGFEASVMTETVHQLLDYGLDIEGEAREGDAPSSTSIICRIRISPDAPPGLK
jgi:hypothetical protein